MSSFRTLQKGVTLIEVLLVMVIMSAVFVMLIGYTTQKTEQIRLDRATLQMQQILNAGLAYYVNNGQWPVNCGSPTLLNGSDLQTNNYLPNQTTNNPWGGDYYLNCASTTGNFTVIAALPAAVSDATIEILAGRLPMGVPNTSTNQVSASVSLPGQNLNNARSVNFAGIYHPSACIPVPSCPTGMTAQIMVTPVGVSGVTKQFFFTPSHFDPIASFTAYATGPAAATGSSGPPVCNLTSSNTNIGPPSTGTVCYSGTDSSYQPVIINDNQKYWRACMYVATTQGPVNPSGTTWGWENSQYLLALTRCAPPAEPVGSNFNIYFGP